MIPRTEEEEAEISKNCRLHQRSEYLNDEVDVSVRQSRKMTFVVEECSTYLSVLSCPVDVCSAATVNQKVNLVIHGTATLYLLLSHNVKIHHKTIRYDCHNATPLNHIANVVWDERPAEEHDHFHHGCLTAVHHCKVYCGASSRCNPNCE